MKNTEYLIAMLLSMFVMAVAVSLWLATTVESAKNRFNIKARSKFPITGFQAMTGGIFLGAVIIFYPVYYFNYDVMSYSADIFRVLKTLLLSVHNTIRLFILDGEFNIISEALVNWDGTRIVSDGVYEAITLYTSALYVMAPVLSAGVVLTFFKNAKSAIKYALTIGSDIYVMSELNEMSVALAKDILEEASFTDRRIVVFTDVFEKNEEENYELASYARRMGAILFKKDITELNLTPLLTHLPFFRNIKRKIYFIGMDMDENTSQALALIASCRNTEAYNTDRTEMYVFSNTVESEVLLNSVDNGNIKVRRINESRNRAIRILREHSIYADAITREDGIKVMNVAIVGLGGLGTELLKAVCWTGQMYGYEINAHVFSLLEDNEAYVRSVAPELVKYNKMRIPGEPYYSIEFHDGVDVKDQRFLDIFETTGNITTAFVTLGDDELNLETAMRMRMMFGRLHHIDGTNIPPILAIVYSNLKTDTIMAPGGLKSIKGDDYGIKLVGDFESCYTVREIEQSDLETEGLKCHLRWSKTAEDKAAAKRLFEKFEYYRRSSSSEALHAMFRRELGLVPGANGGALDEAITETEHKRWNAFMRAEGYVGGRVKDDVAKTHHDLVPFEELDEATIDKDRIVLNEEE